MLNLKLLDLGKNTCINSLYDSYRKMLTWDRERIIQFSEKRLHQLINHSFAHVPYYRKIMLENNITPAMVLSAKDLQIFPVLDRDTIHSEKDAMLSDTFLKKQIHKGSSSGTTGIPVTYYYDNYALSAGKASGYTLWAMSGWKPGHRNIHIWGNATSIKRWNSWSSRLKNRLLNQKNIASVLLDDPENLETISGQILKYNPVSLEGYTSAIYTLAQHFRERKLKIPGLKQVFTTAENLEDYQRNLIEDSLAPTSDLYGCGEVNGIACRPVNDDKYYVFEPHVILEVIDSGIQGMKDVLLTDLDNYAMPIIRYKIGDMVDDLYLPDSSSRYQLPYFKSIIGRSSDVITLANGMRFHPVNIFGGTLFRMFPGISRHKVIWNGDTLNFIFERKGAIDENALRTKLEAILLPYNVKFSIEFVQGIAPGSNGKYKYIEIIRPGVK